MSIGGACGRVDVIKERVTWGNSANLLNNIRIYYSRLTWPQSQSPHIYKLSIEDGFLAFIRIWIWILRNITAHLYVLKTWDRASPLFCSGFLNFSSVVFAYQHGLCEDTIAADYTRSWCLLEFTRLTRDYNFLKVIRVNLNLWGEMPHVYSNPVVGDFLIQPALVIKTLIREGHIQIILTDGAKVEHRLKQGWQCRVTIQKLMAWSWSAIQILCLSKSTNTVY